MKSSEELATMLVALWQIKAQLAPEQQGAVLQRIAEIECCLTAIEERNFRGAGPLALRGTDSGVTRLY